MAAEVILSGLAAALQAVEVWLTLRDRKLAAQAFRTTYDLREQDPAMFAQARSLEALVPPRVLEAMKDRISRCWERYEEVLADEGSYLPDEIDSATEALKQCVCRELRRIQSLNGSMPPGDLSRWWEAYCQRKRKTSGRRRR